VEEGPLAILAIHSYFTRDQSRSDASTRSAGYLRASSRQTRVVSHIHHGPGLSHTLPVPQAQAL
jgi:hypothetical protein